MAESKQQEVIADVRDQLISLEPQGTKLLLCNTFRDLSYDLLKT
jgi:hypothetical protein